MQQHRRTSVVSHLEIKNNYSSIRRKSFDKVQLSLKGAGRRLSLSNDKRAKALRSQPTSILFPTNTKIKKIKVEDYDVPKISKSKYKLALVPQLVPRGYPRRWKDVIRDISSISNILENCATISHTNYFGYAVGVFSESKDTDSSDYCTTWSTLVALITLDDVALSQSDESVLLYSLYERSSVKSSKFLKIEFDSLNAANDWVTFLTPCISTEAASKIRNFPNCILEKNEDTIRSEIELSQYAELEEGEKGYQLISGTFSDNVLWSLYQCNQTKKNIPALQSLLIYMETNDIPFLKFQQTLSTLNISLNSDIWLPRLIVMGEQISRSYSIVSHKDRSSFLKFVYELVGNQPASIQQNMKDYSQCRNSVRKNLPQLFATNPERDSTTFFFSIKELEQFPVKDLAEQLTYLEAKHQKQIQIADLFKTFSTLPRQSGLKQSVQWWNQINFWVAGEILTQPTAKSQLTILTKFLNVAVELFRLRNYSTCSQILTGITHNTVQRIKILQSIIPKESRDILANLKEKLSHERNYQSYRNLDFSSPYLGLLPMYQRDLIYIVDGNEKEIEDNVINVDRMNMISEVIEKSGLTNPEYHFSYTFKRNFTIEQFIIERSIFSEEDLYELSEKVQPRSQPKVTSPRKSKSAPNIPQEIKYYNPLHNSDKLRILINAQ